MRSSALAALASSTALSDRTVSASRRTSPLILQIDPEAPPELFELPPSAARLVDIVHPRVANFASLQLKWYAIPAVSSIELSVGGMQYTASPFNGWYMTTEIGTRNFGDESRYNLLPAVATLLGLDTKNETSMWREHALAVLNEAVAFSFGAAGVSVANHHLLARSFETWHASELKTRGYCPANWKWLVPPTAGSTCPFYLGGNKFVDYTLFPAYLYSPGWQVYLERAISLGQMTRNALVAACSLKRSVSRVANTLSSVLLAKSGLVSAKHVLVFYAGSQGSTRMRAQEAAALLSKLLDARDVDLATFAAQGHTGMRKLADQVAEADACLLLTSTCGSGDLPKGAHELRAALQADDASHPTAAALRRAFGATPTALFGRGNSSYARYNRGGDWLDGTLRERATPCLDALIPYARGDELNDEAGAFRSWLAGVVRALAQRGLVKPSRAEKVVAAHIEGDGAGALQPGKLRWQVMSLEHSARLASPHLASPRLASPHPLTTQCCHVADRLRHALTPSPPYHPARPRGPPLLTTPCCHVAGRRDRPLAARRHVALAARHAANLWRGHRQQRATRCAVVCPFDAARGAWLALDRGSWCVACTRYDWRG
jgi:hypothetical protein